MTNTAPLEIKVELVFTEDSITSILDTGNQINGTNVTIDDLKKDPELFQRFSEELSSSDFTLEIIESSYEAMANDWMCDFFDSLPSDND